MVLKKRGKKKFNIFSKYLKDICAYVYFDLLLTMSSAVLGILLLLHPFTECVHFIVAVKARMINIWTGLLVPITPDDRVKRREKEKGAYKQACCAECRRISFPMQLHKKAISPPLVKWP